MAIGTISAPSTWILGTVFTPAWGNNAQDTINALYATMSAGTRSYHSLVIDGTGAASVTPAGAASVDLRAPSTSEIVPRIVAKDSSGNVRWELDHNGFPMHPLIEWHEHWQTGNTTTGGGDGLSTSHQLTDNPAWRLNSLGASDTFTVGSATTTPFTYGIITATSGAFAYLRSGRNVCRVTSGGVTSMVMEVDCRMLAAPTNSNLYIGFSASATRAPATSVNRIIFRSLAGANWFAITGTSSAETTTDCSAAPAIDTWDRFRIEFHDTASAFGAGTVKYFLNGTLKATHTTNLPAAQSVLILFIGAENASSGSSVMHISPVRVVMNRRLSSSLV